MHARRLAVVCATDARLRAVCSILLRHAAYRVLEVESVREARSIIESDQVALVTAGVLADPDGELTALASSRKIPCLRLGANLHIEALLKLFEQIQV